MKDDQNSAAFMSGDEALATYQSGGKLLCPTCFSVLITIPADLAPGQLPAVLQCPLDRQHYLIIAENADAMDSVHRGMEAILGRDEPTKT